MLPILIAALVLAQVSRVFLGAREAALGNNASARARARQGLRDMGSRPPPFPPLKTEAKRGEGCWVAPSPCVTDATAWGGGGAGGERSRCFLSPRPAQKPLQHVSSPPPANTTHSQGATPAASLLGFKVRVVWGGIWCVCVLCASRRDPLRPPPPPPKKNTQPTLEPTSSIANKTAAVTGCDWPLRPAPRSKRCLRRWAPSPT